MLTKTKIVLATALFAATSSAALAQGFDPNMANRYPGYANPAAPTAQPTAPHASLHSAPVRLREGRDVGMTSDYGNYSGTESEFDVDRNDRASSPYAGGGF